MSSTGAPIYMSIIVGGTLGQTLHLQIGTNLNTPTIDGNYAVGAIINVGAVVPIGGALNVGVQNLGVVSTDPNIKPSAVPWSATASGTSNTITGPTFTSGGGGESFITFSTGIITSTSSSGGIGGTGGGGIQLPPGGGSVGTGTLQLTKSVTDQKTLQPIGGATVVLQSPDGTITIATTTTNPNGTCAFANLAAGSYNINVTASGYQPNGESVNFQNNQIVVNTLTATGTGGPPTSGGCGAYPTFTGNSTDVGDWLNFLGSVLGWCVCQIWTYLLSVFGLTPAQVQAFVNDVQAAASNTHLFLIDPHAAIRNLLLWAAGVSNSPSAKALTRVVAQAIVQGTNDSYQFAADLIAPIYLDVFQTIITNYNSQLLTLSQQTNLSAADLETQIIALKQKSASQVYAWTTLLELIPTVNLISAGQFAKEALTAIGADELHDRRIQAQFAAGADPLFKYEANAAHPITIPPTNTLQILYVKGVIDLPTFQSLAAQNDAYSATNIQNLLNAARNPPSLQDIITWNLRHPDKAKPLNTVADLTGEDTLLFGDVLGERQYTDPNLIAVRTLARLGKLTTGDITSILTRHGYRSDVLPGQSISDLAAMQLYLQEQDEVSIDKKLLSSYEKLYLQGQIQLSDLQTQAQIVYPAQDEYTKYIQYAQNQYQAGIGRPKHFTYSQMIKMAEEGVDITPIMAADLAATGLDVPHQNLLQKYIVKVLVGKGVSFADSSIAELRPTV